MLNRIFSLFKKKENNSLIKEQPLKGIERIKNETDINIILEYKKVIDDLMNKFYIIHFYSIDEYIYIENRLCTNSYKYDNNMILKNSNLISLDDFIEDFYFDYNFKKQNKSNNEFYNLFHKEFFDDLAINFKVKKELDELLKNNDFNNLYPSIIQALKNSKDLKNENII